MRKHGQKNLLRLILFGVFLLTLPVQGLWAESRNTFRSASLGITITKPDAWFFISSAALKDNSMVMESNNELMEQLMKELPGPLVIIAKYREPYADVNPSISIDVDDIGAGPQFDLKKFVEMAVFPILQKTTRNFRVLVPPQDATLAGRAAIYAKLRYDMMTKKGGKLLPTRSEMWLLRHRQRLITVTLSSREDESNGRHAELLRILETLKLAD